MNDAVLSYHADPVSCGVAKFSQHLARRLGVPWGAGGAWVGAYPLVSVKFSELTTVWDPWVPFDAFVHDVDGASALVSHATRLFAASAAVAEAIRPHRPEVITAWCPSLVEAHPREPITVLSFGMAHKLRTDLYATLKDKLDATGEPYVVSVSAALHDGTSFRDAAGAFDTLRRMFGPRFVFLGTLSDEAMVDRLRTSTYVAAFFDDGLRENNTSVMAALEQGATVLTNWDRHTPPVLMAHTVSIDDDLPHVVQRRHLHEAYGWDKLVELIRRA